MQRGRRWNRWGDFWLGIPLLNVLATVRPRRKPPERVERIGVLCAPALGDTLIFSAALQDLRAAFRQAEIVHFCTKQNMAAAEMIPGASRRVVVSMTQPLEMIRQMRAERLDVLLDFTPWQRLTAFCTMLSGARYRVGFRRAGQYRSRGYDRAVEHRSDRHEVENHRALLREYGLRTTVATRHSPAVWLETAGETPFAEESDVVAMHLWASGQRAWLREWPEERWLELAQRLAQEKTLFVVTGAPSDRERMEPFVARMRGAGIRCEGFVSPDGFRSLVRLLLRARLVVTVNTGVMHLAAISGATTVSINGPNRNERWGPLGVRAVGVEAPGEGCGYLDLGFNFDGNPTDCMERITVEQVATACENLLAGEAPV